MPQNSQRQPQWLPEVEEHSFPFAEFYLSLIYLAAKSDGTRG